MKKALVVDDITVTRKVISRMLRRFGFESVEAADGSQVFAERLDAQSPLRVVEASAGMKIERGTVYVAPGDFHLEAVRVNGEVQTHVHKGQQENSCRPAVDVLFRSAIPLFGGGILGVVLTGMGQDGLNGCRHIREAGGSVLVQDQATSVVWGMPGYVAEAGLADAILPLDNVAQEISRRVLTSRTSRLQAERRA